MKAKLSLLAVIVLFITNAASAGLPTTIPGEQDKINYLKTHFKEPENYIIEKFKKHDLVIVGEMHHVQQNLELLQRLIPRLYKQAGVRFLGYEFFASSCQKDIDALVNAKQYDEALARDIVRKSAIRWGLLWPYQEYVDVFKTVWRLNQGISKPSQRFRIIFMQYDMNWRDFHYGNEIQKKTALLNLMEGDKHYAEPIMREYDRTGHKGLIWCGTTHAVAHLRGNGKNRPKLRMGGYLHKSYGNKVFQIMLHSPWLYYHARVEFDYALDGILDKVLNEFSKPIGFDIAGSPWANIKLPHDFMWASDNPGSTFADYCDGYVWLLPLAQFKGNHVMDIEEIVPDDQTFRKIIHNASGKTVHELKTRKEYLALFRTEATDKFSKFQKNFMPFLSGRDKETR